MRLVNSLNVCFVIFSSITCVFQVCETKFKKNSIGLIPRLRAGILNCIAPQFSISLFARLEFWLGLPSCKKHFTTWIIQVCKQKICFPIHSVILFTCNYSLFICNSHHKMSHLVPLPMLDLLMCSFFSNLRTFYAMLDFQEPLLDLLGCF